MDTAENLPLRWRVAWFGLCGWLIGLIPVGAPAGPLGHAEFRANRQLAEALGITVPDGSFSVLTSSLEFSTRDLELFAGGEIVFDQGTIRAVPGTRTLSLDGGFLLENPHVAQQGDRLWIANMDIRYGEWVVGMAHVLTAFRPPPRPLGAPCPPNFGAGVDVALTALNSLQQVTRSGGMVSLAPATRLQNVGDFDVPWYWAISPPAGYAPVIGQHPYVIFNLYRVLDGFLEQIGRSEAKHAFFSTNEDCPCDGSQWIVVDCADTYSVGSNSDQFFFGPRREIHAFSGAWTSLGSHFDGIPVDDNRDHPGEGDNLTHLLIAPEAALQSSNAQYFIEAWYVVQNDTNIFNSMGHRMVTPSFNGSVWSFAFDTTLTTGPVVNSWTADTNVLVDTGEGRLHLAAATTGLSNGLVRYHYALMNHDFDRQIRSFALPLPSGVTVTNIVFADHDGAVADWTPALTNETLSWSASASNGLDWGVMYSFAFDANVPAEDGTVALGVLETDSNEQCAVSSRVPHVPAAVQQTDSQITWSAVSGHVYQLQSSEVLTSHWTNAASPVTAQSNLFVIVEPDHSASQTFFRAVLQTAE